MVIFNSQLLVITRPGITGAASRSTQKQMTGRCFSIALLVMVLAAAQWPCSVVWVVASTRRQQMP